MGSSCCKPEADDDSHSSIGGNNQPPPTAPPSSFPVAGRYSTQSHRSAVINARVGELWRSAGYTQESYASSSTTHAAESGSNSFNNLPRSAGYLLPIYDMVRHQAHHQQPPAGATPMNLAEASAMQPPRHSHPWSSGVR